MKTLSIRLFICTIIIANFSSCTLLKEVIYPYGSPPKTRKLIVNLRHIDSLSKELSEIDYNLLYRADEEIASFKSANPAKVAQYKNDKDLFYAEILPTLEAWEKELHRSVVVVTGSLREFKRIKKKLEADTNVVFVQENQKIETDYIPNDPYYASMWSLSKINCNSAWDLAEGKDVLVAVIDNGTFVNQLDIRNNLWVGPNKNFGFNFIGSNFYDVNPLPSDPDPRHGTHVAGTIAAIGNNNVDVIGVAPKAKILTLRALPGDDLSLLQAIQYAIKYNAKVINNSWGTKVRRPYAPEYSRILETAHQKNIVVVFSAGNENDDVQFYAPANNSRVIAVASTNNTDSRSYFSNYGPLVDIGAPGEGIISLDIKPKGITVMQGTSMSAPHVSGLAALLLSLDPSLTAEQVKEIIERTAVPLPANQNIPNGRLNAYNALFTTLTTQRHLVPIRVSTQIRDQDNWSSDEYCNFELSSTHNLLPLGDFNTNELITPRCDGEVSIKIRYIIAMDLDRTVRISGTVDLFDGDSFQGSLSFNDKVPFGTHSYRISNMVTDGERDGDWAKYTITIDNIN